MLILSHWKRNHHHLDWKLLIITKWPHFQSWLKTSVNFIIKLVMTEIFYSDWNIVTELKWWLEIIGHDRRVVDNRAARSNRACAIRRNHIIFKTAHWSRIDRALIAHWSRIDYAWSRIDRALIAHWSRIFDRAWLRLIAHWSRIDRALIAHWSRLIAHWSRIDRALIAPDRALIAHWSRIFCAINARSGAIRRN